MGPSPGPALRKKDVLLPGGADTGARGGRHRLPDPDFVHQAHTRRVNSSQSAPRGPTLKSNRKPDVHTHYFPRKCIWPSNQHPHTEREQDGGRGSAQLKRRHLERVSPRLSTFMSASSSSSSSSSPSSSSVLVYRECA